MFKNKGKVGRMGAELVTRGVGRMGEEFLCWDKQSFFVT